MMMRDMFRHFSHRKLVEFLALKREKQIRNGAYAATNNVVTLLSKLFCEEI